MRLQNIEYKLGSVRTAVLTLRQLPQLDCRTANVLANSRRYPRELRLAPSTLALQQQPLLLLSNTPRGDRGPTAYRLDAGPELVRAVLDGHCLDDGIKIRGDGKRYMEKNE